MTPDRTPRSDPPAGGHTGTEAIPITVLVAGEATVTDRIAGLLRDRHRVRSVTSADALYAALDETVGVILFDPDLDGVSTARLVDRIEDDAVDCHLAAIASSAPDRPASFDEVLVGPVSGDRLRATVDRLSRQAAYRITLERYYDLVERAANADPGETPAVEDRLATVRAQLDAALAALDRDEAYRAALREHDAD